MDKSQKNDVLWKKLDKELFSCMILFIYHEPIYNER